MYCEVEDLRAEGVAEPPEDDRLEQLIKEATEYIDLVTRMWFEEREFTMKLDGNGRRTLHLYIPIREITEVRIDGVIIDESLYAVYNRIFPDDRTNPRVAFKRVRERPSIFQGSLNPRDRLWTLGEQNIELDGTFGYVECDSDGTNPYTPELIKRACKRMVIRTIPLLGDTESLLSAMMSSPGMLQSETTDGHSYSTQSNGATQTNTASSKAVLGLTGDSDIDGALLKFIAKRPHFVEVA
jgi:hypothetical protein